MPSAQSSPLKFKAQLTGRGPVAHGPASKSPAISRSFAALSYSHKKEYVDWIDNAKKPKTRQKRIEKMAEMLAVRKTPKG